jgi:hypothetical protein
MKHRFTSHTLILIFGFTFFITAVNAQNNGIATVVHDAGSETTAAIMNRQSQTPPGPAKERPEREYPNRRHLPQNPLSPRTSSYPPNAQINSFNGGPPSLNIAQTPGTSFTGASLSDKNIAPPDNMGAVGPTQYIVFVNNVIRSFNKTTGVADGVLNANPDVFFVSAMTAPTSNNFTSDPRIRYDRLSGKWILLIIDVPGQVGSLANRCMIAYSNTSTITAATVWTFRWFLGQTSKFLDYPTLGIDVNALYIGGNMFNLTGSFSGTNGYVINRNTLLSGAAITAFTFTNLCTSSGSGPFTPQGVDNYDINATEGYFIGVDNIAFGKLQVRRVSTPGGTPTISANISITVPATGGSLAVPNLGGATLDALDDRLYAAVMRNGHVFTAHAFSVTATGVAGTTQGREGCRWYELQNLTGTPSLVQSGTVFDPAATAAAARWVWVPTLMVSGQGHAAFSLTSAGSAFRTNAMTTGRLAGDALGTTQVTTLTTNSTSGYNGGANARWGDYSYVSLDPVDDMTMWMINQFCNSSNSYACNVTKLLAPPPAEPSACSPSSAATGLASVIVTVTGAAVNGSGFYDPGANLSAPALPFHHISATVTGGVVVNSISYTDPTHIVLDLNTTSASNGCQFITVTNPDGQIKTSPVCIFTTAASCSSTLTSAPGTNNQTRCINSPVTAITYATTAATGATFSGLPAGVTGAWASNVVTISGAPTAPGTFNYIVHLTGGSCSSETANGTITVNPLPTPSISGSTSFCAVNATVLNAGTYVGYNWSNGATTQTIVVNTSGTFTVTVTDANGCTGSTTATITVNPNPTPSISGSTSFCAGSSTILDAGTFAGYNWSTGATTQTISVNTAGTFTVTVTDANGCTGSISTTTTVNLNPTPSISGSTSFCAGSATILDAGTNPAYNWSTGETTQAILVNTAGTFTVTVTDANGCTGSASATTTVNPNPTPAISGNTSFCAGGSTILDAGAYSGYNWSTGATTQTVEVSSADTYTVTVTDANGCSGTASAIITESAVSTWYFDNDADGYYSTAQSSCASPGGGWSLTTNGLDCDDDNPLATTVLTWYLDADGDSHYVGSVSSCGSPGAGYNTLGGTSGDCDDNDNTIYQSALLYGDADADGYDAGLTTVCYGATIPSGYNATTNGNDCDDNNASAHAIETWYLDADNDTHYISSASSCGSPGAGYNTLGGTLDDCDDNNNSVYQSALLYVDADADGYDAGSSPVCYGAAVPSGYSATTAGPDCNDNNTNVYPGATETCNSIDDNCNAQVDETGVTTSITTSDATTFCDPATALLNASPTGAGYSYQWYEGANIISGATASSYTAGASGNYSVLTSLALCTGTSNSISITKNSAPSASVTPDGPLSGCKTDVFTLSANTGDGLAYQWYRNSIPISAAINATWIVAAGKIGDYTVVVTSSNDCSATSNVVNVSRLATPVSNITLVTPANNPDLCINGSVKMRANASLDVLLGYQWILNGSDIAGATNRLFTALTTGSYRVRVINLSTGCSTVSAMVAVFSSCKINADLKAAGEMKVYPNPADGHFTIHLVLNNRAESKVLIQVYNSIGQITQEETVPILDGELVKDLWFDKSDEPGVYFIHVIFNDQVFDQQLIYQR